MNLSGERDFSQGQSHAPTRRPTPLPVEPKTIPTELKSLHAWVVWRFVLKDGRRSKEPFQACSPNAHASTTSPSTWSRFDDALASYKAGRADGVGLVLRDDLVGIDLDHVFDAEGTLESWAQEILKHFCGAYVERSPSGEGLRIFCKGAPQRCGKGGPGKRVEVYSKDSPRYLTATGHVLPQSSSEVVGMQLALDWLHETCMQKPKAIRLKPNGAHLSDDEVLAKCRGARNSAKFLALWAGETGEDHSAADLSLMSLMSFYTQDADQLDRLFRRSGLMRDKWDERHSGDGRTYGHMTIAKALERSEIYVPHHYSNVTPQTAALRTEAIGAKQDWPVLDEAALHGPAGEIVRTIAPNTEADCVAILIQLLVGWGIYVGRGPYYQVEGDKHYSNLFALLVGSTSKGRKGTSWGRVYSIFKSIGGGFCPVVSGLSSGEGLKYHVRDPVADNNDKPIDAGVEDKRLLVQEAEFAQVLRVVVRQGNTLSATVRSAWDTGDMRTLTKNDATVATGAHIGIIGHITEDELRKELAQSDAANGFANRFLFVCVRRSKTLPLGGAALGQANLAEWAGQLERAAHAARQRKRVELTESAKAHWIKIYPVLSEGHPGLFGAVTGRAEAQVMRLALVYALLDCGDAIDLPHLLAAEALWVYCEVSARYVFGSALGDAVADEILRALRAARSDGLSRTQIRDLFKRNQSAERIGFALDLLRERGLAHSEQRTTQGRPSEQWFSR